MRHRFIVFASVAVAGGLAFAPAPGHSQPEVAHEPDQGTVQVQALDHYFSPGEVTVTTGTTVSWTNLGTAPHTATGSAGLFDSGQLDPGQAYSFTFTTPGEYDYVCTFHASAGMIGRVTVIGGVEPTPTAAAAPSQPGANLALGKFAQASSWHPSHPPRLAVDGNHSTFWASRPATGAASSAQHSDAAPYPYPYPYPSPDTTADRGTSPQPSTAAVPQINNPQWFLIDLGAVHLVERMDMLWVVGRHARAYSVYAWLPGCGWCHLGSTMNGRGHEALTLRQPIATRHLLLWLVYPAVSSGPYHLREWRVFGPSAPSGNLAAGRPAVASSWRPGFEAFRASDRSLATQWQPAGLPAWIYVDLGQPQRVNAVVLRWAPGLHASRWALYAWTGAAWHGLVGSNAGPPGTATATFPPTITRYVLLWTVAGPGPTVGLRELEIYGLAGAFGGLLTDDSGAGPSLGVIEDTWTEMPGELATDDLPTYSVEDGAFEWPPDVHEQGLYRSPTDDSEAAWPDPRAADDS